MIQWYHILFIGCLYLTFLGLYYLCLILFLVKRTKRAEVIQETNVLMDIANFIIGLTKLSIIIVSIITVAIALVVSILNEQSNIVG